MSEENKELLRRWFEEVWNKGNAEAIDEMFYENGTAYRMILQRRSKGLTTSDRFTPCQSMLPTESTT